MTAAGDARKRQQPTSATEHPLSQPNAAESDSGAIGRLSEGERAQIDERIAEGHWGYYLHFNPTGVPEVDRILSAVGLAAKAFHHTEDWNADLDWDHGPISKGETCADFIQRAADDAAAIVRTQAERAWDEALAEAERIVVARRDELNSGYFEAKRGCDIAARAIRAARQEQGR